MKPIKIGMFDDNPIILNGLSAVFKDHPQIEVLFQCTSPDEVSRLIEEHQPDVMMLDVLSEGISGVEVYRAVRKHFPDLLLLSFTNVNSISVIKSLFAAGANGYLHKSSDPNKLPEIIKYMVDSGKIYVPEEIPIRAEILKKQTPLHLTKAEKIIIQDIVAGLTTKEIASKSFISENTVEFHRKNLLRKFEVHNMAELVREAVAFGYDKM